MNWPTLRLMRRASAAKVKRDVGRRLAEVRADHGWTQEQLAERAGTSVKYVQRIEAGKENLTIESVVRLANILGVAAVDLFAKPTTRAPKPGRPRRTGPPPSRG